MGQPELRIHGVLRSSPIRLCEVHTIPIYTSQSVLRIGIHSVPFRGSVIVPTMFYFLSRALKGSISRHPAHPQTNDFFVATSPDEWVAKSMDRLIHQSAWNRNSRKLAQNSSGIHRLLLAWLS